ncbi:DUF1707 SHOCT-like domain-containing protein [Pseudonocardia sp. TRM90224]|uniref:DUF1707 SHOCT-like domain-containing protein n=1 Tax=Pseudonocardia sp. TRM90224 TaxID=2812678 RepID=UPI001E429972|nr:DUF1707 domain-containing protein [Pseudonocardia sp. TRM90224]
MGELELRISDTDRDRAAAVLHTAVGEGRLSWDEHGERLEGVYAARTRGELQPWLADLPVRLAGTAVVPEQPLRVTLSKVRRRPDPASRTVNVDVTLGAAVLDLCGLPAGTEVDVVANSLLGKVEVHVSRGTRLIDTGTASLGKRSVVEHQPRGWSSVVLPPDAPVVRIGGHSMLGHVRVTVR